MNRTLIRILACMTLITAVRASLGNEPTGGVGADEALKRLMDGNVRFVAGKSNTKGADLTARRAALAKEQKPFATVLSCSDSRVPPELVFEVGLGDIFVVRTAGQVVDSIDIGSIEYAVEHLGQNLIVVLGHQRCGAVSAAVSGGTESGHIPDVVKAIAAAVEETKGKPGDAIDNAVRANAVDVAKQLQSSPIIAPRVQAGTLKIVPARYDLDSGKVELLK